MPVILGIDPGLTGALAVYDGTQLHIDDMPVVQDGKKNFVNEYGLQDLFDNYALLFPDIEAAWIEKVGPMPKQGVTSSFNFGTGYGCVRQAIASNRIPMFPVAPVKWKMDMGLTSDGNKSIARALKLFPNNSAEFSRKKDHGRAEAALIAYYGYKGGNVRNG